MWVRVVADAPPPKPNETETARLKREAAAFEAGFAYSEETQRIIRTAPKLAFMLGWSCDMARKHFAKLGWKATKLPDDAKRTDEADADSAG